MSIIDSCVVEGLTANNYVVVGYSSRLTYAGICSYMAIRTKTDTIHVNYVLYRIFGFMVMECLGTGA